MDFTFGADEDLLRETARDHLTRAPKDGEGHARPAWEQLVAGGWTDPTLTPVQLAILADEAGYALLTQPWLITVGSAGPAFQAAGRDLDRPATLVGVGARQDIRSKARGSRISGFADTVPYPGPDAILVVKAFDEDDVPSLVVVSDPVGLAIECPSSLVDPTCPAINVTFDETPTEPLVDPATTATVLAQARRRTVVLQTCEAIGVSRRALRLATDYARSRTQFGRQIGSFQAVSHRLADVYATVELATALAYRAAWSLDQSVVDSALPEPVLSAWLGARAAAIQATQAAIQTFGATGFLWDHPVAALHRRACWLQSCAPSAHQLRADLAAHLLDEPSPGVDVRASFSGGW